MDRIQYGVLFNKQKKLMMRLEEVHIDFLKVSGQLYQTDEWRELVSLAITIRPSHDPTVIYHVGWVVDAEGQRKMLLIGRIDSGGYPSMEGMIEVSVTEIPPPVLQEFDRRWKQISRKPWVPPKRLKAGDAKKVLQFPPFRRGEE